jgi:hypothetical protein
MKQSTRIILFLFAIMVFGSFASFAQNEWGNELIFYCQLGMLVTFGVEVAQGMRDSRRERGKSENWFFKTVYFTFLGSMALFLVPLCLETMHLLSGHVADAIKSTALTSGAVFATLVSFIPIYCIYHRILCRIRKKENKYLKKIWENFLLVILMAAFFFKHMYWPYAHPMFALSIFCLCLLYARSTRRIYREFKEKNRNLARVLALACWAGVFFGISAMFKIQHWKNSDVPFYIAVLLSAAFAISAAIKQKYDSGTGTITIKEAMQSFSNHIILLYFLVGVNQIYFSLADKGIAPRFYSHIYPPAVDHLSRLGTPEAVKEANDIKEAYDDFMEHCEKNGLLDQ